MLPGGIKATVERMERADGLLEDLNASSRTAGAIDPADDVKPGRHYLQFIRVLPTGERILVTRTYDGVCTLLLPPLPAATLIEPPLLVM